MLNNHPVNLVGVLVPGFVAVICLSGAMAKTQTEKSSTTAGDLFVKIRKLDQEFFEAYNKCDLKKMESLFTDDIEFYHEKHGLVRSRTTVMEAISKGLCGDAKNKVRRELVEETLSVYTINDYGALETGEHRFYLTNPGLPEKLDGVGHFSNVWQLKDGEWKISRVLSYGFRSK